MTLTFGATKVTAKQAFATRFYAIKNEAERPYGENAAGMLPKLNVGQWCEIGRTTKKNMATEARKDGLFTWVTNTANHCRMFTTGKGRSLRLFILVSVNKAQTDINTPHIRRIKRLA